MPNTDKIQKIIDIGGKKCPPRIGGQNDFLCVLSYLISLFYAA